MSAYYTMLPKPEKQEMTLAVPATLFPVDIAGSYGIRYRKTVEGSRSHEDQTIKRA